MSKFKLVTLVTLLFIAVSSATLFNSCKKSPILQEKAQEIVLPTFHEQQTRGILKKYLSIIDWVLYPGSFSYGWTYNTTTGKTTYWKNCEGFYGICKGHGSAKQAGSSSSSTTSMWQIDSDAIALEVTPGSFCTLSPKLENGSFTSEADIYFDSDTWQSLEVTPFPIKAGNYQVLTEDTKSYIILRR